MAQPIPDSQWEPVLESEDDRRKRYPGVIARGEGEREGKFPDVDRVGGTLKLVPHGGQKSNSRPDQGYLPEAWVVQYSRILGRSGRMPARGRLQFSHHASHAYLGTSTALSFPWNHVRRSNVQLVGTICWCRNTASGLVSCPQTFISVAVHCGVIWAAA